MVLDDWQRWVLAGTCGERADGSWAAFEAALIVPRQNGKNGILMARELAGLVLFGDELIVHSAHRVDTTLEHFRNMLRMCDECDDLGRLVKHVSKVNGHEGIELRDGRRIQFVSRARTPGRGFTGTMIVLDEAFDLEPKVIGAMIPTLATRADRAQVWYTSSAPHHDSEVLHGVRARGHAGGDADPRLFFAEWCNEPDVAYDDLDAAYAANPALGIRITEEFVISERRLMAAVPDEYRRERLGVAEAELLGPTPPIPLPQWDACVNMESELPPRGLHAAVDLAPDRVSASIAVAGTNADGQVHIEVVDFDREVDSLVAALKLLDRRYRLTDVTANLSGPIGAYHNDLRAAFLKRFVPIADSDMVKACGLLADAVRDGQVAHHGQPSLRQALEGSAKKVSGDAWRWSRVSSATNIAPLVAVTAALWATVGVKKKAAFVPRRVR